MACYDSFNEQRGVSQSSCKITGGHECGQSVAQSVVRYGCLNVRVTWCDVPIPCMGNNAAHFKTEEATQRVPGHQIPVGTPCKLLFLIPSLDTSPAAGKLEWCHQA